MHQPTYYMQECPTCGRNLHVRLEYLGRQIVCQHCQAHFKACEPVGGAASAEDSSSALLRRADELLASVSAQLSKTSNT